MIISELQAMIKAVGGPSSVSVTDPDNPYPGLTKFSLLSHGFGNPTINIALNSVQAYLQALLSIYKQKQTIDHSTK